MTFPSTVIVFGASGFVGRNLINRLQPKIERLIAVSATGGVRDGLATIGFEEALALDLAPDTIVVNVAAYRYDASNFVEAQNLVLSQNVDIVNRVYQFCVQKGIKELRAASSIAVYPSTAVDLDDRVPVDLNIDPYDSERMYGWSKRIQEVYARLYEKSHGIHTILFRLSNPFGPFDCLVEESAHVVPAFIIRALAHPKEFAVRGNPLAARDFIYVEDVCRAFEISLAWREKSNAYNIAQGQNLTIQDLATKILKLVGVDCPVSTSGASTNLVVSRNCLVAQFKADFNMETFTTVDDGLAKTIEWYQNALQE